MRENDYPNSFGRRLARRSRRVVEAPPSNAAPTLVLAEEETELCVLLVTDLVGFTPIVCALGDARALAFIRSHDQCLRAYWRQNNGRAIAHSGDGTIASFADPSLRVCELDWHAGLRSEPN
jgi:class 3 adenylate cyclase